MHKKLSYKRIVNFYETDSARIVHFSNFFRYVEEAEHELMKSIPESSSLNIVWLRTHFACDFYSPIKFDEEFTVDITATDINATRIHYDFFISKDGNPVAKGSYEAKPLYFSHEDNDFHEKIISETLINAIIG